MYQINAKVVLDQGNSQERGCVIYPANGILKKEMFELSNSFSYIDDSYKVPENYTSDTSSIFSASFKMFQNKSKSNGVDSEPTVKIGDDLEEVSIDSSFVHGILCRKEFLTTSFRPSATMKKYLNLNTPLAFIMAIYKSTELIAKGLGVQDLNDLSITWDVVTLLPPNDVEKGKGIIEATFRSIKQVKFTMPSYIMNIKINSLKVYPEGFCAFMGATFTDDYKVREGYADLINGKILVLDIGAGTTDLMLIDKASVVDNSKDSLTIGGNQVTQAVKRYLRKNDIDLPDDDIQDAIVTGHILDGARNVNIVKVVQKFKQETAQAEVQKLRDYFDTCGILPRTISHILICGGGSLGGNIPELTPLSEMLEQYLKALAPNSVIVPIPKDESGKPISPRHLNLIGAIVLTLLK